MDLKTDLQRLPYHVKLVMLTFHQCVLEMEQKYDLLDFYGYWENDITRKIFLMFTSFYPKMTVQLSHMPVKYIKYMDFHEEKHWNRNAFPLPEKLLEHCAVLEGLERVFLDPKGVDVISRIKSLSKLAMEIKIVTDETMKNLSNLKYLNAVTIYPQEQSTTTLDFDIFKTTKLNKLVLYKGGFSDSMLQSKSLYNFQSTLQRLQLFGITQLRHIQMETILSFKNIRNLKLCSCGLPSNYILLFEENKLKDLRTLHLQYSTFDKSKLKQLKPPPEKEEEKEEVKLKKLVLTGIDELEKSFVKFLVLKYRLSLEELDLEGCRLAKEVGDVLVKEFKEKVLMVRKKKFKGLNLRRNYQIEKQLVKDELSDLIDKFLI